MKLHTHPEEFRELITVVANEKHISESAVERDYYIVMMLKSLADSPYADQCVFKGGTSLSKCYPGSIDRFSEDIDLTFLGMELSDKACDKTIKKIETIMAAGAQTEKIVEERSNRSKSMYVWFGNPENRVKLEIGSTVRPDPYQKMPVKTCIQEFLESRGFTDDIERFELAAVKTPSATRRQALCLDITFSGLARTRFPATLSTSATMTSTVICTPSILFSQRKIALRP